MDIDIVLDLDQPGADEFYTLHEILERRLFVRDERKPFRYVRGVNFEGEQYQVLVEFLGGGEPPPSGLRRIRTEDVYVSIIKGMEVALDQPIEFKLPDDPSLSLSVASLPASFTMKAGALENRVEIKKTKDAYDIVYCLRNYPGGVEAIANEFSAYVSNPIVASGVALLKELFASTDSLGPVAYAREADDLEDAALKQREAYERVHELLALLEN